MNNIIQTVGLTSAGNGIRLTTQGGGDQQNPILVVKSLIASTGILISSNDSTVTIAATGMPPLTSLITASAHWAGTAVNPNVLPIFLAAYPLVITAIIARVEKASTTPAAVTLVKAVNSIAVSAGVAVASSFDVTLPPFLQHRLILTADITVLRLEPGDCIGMTSTGTWTNAYGGLTIHMAPYYPP